MRNYSRKYIAAYIAAYFIAINLFDIVIIIRYFIEINKIFYYVVGWLNIIVYNLDYLALTGILYFLADFGFETRTN